MRPTTFTATAVAALTGAALALSVPGATSAPPTKSSSYGLSVSGGGEQVVPPTPYVESTDGSNQTGGGQIPDNPLAAGGVVAVTAGNDQASATVTDLTLGAVAAEFPPELREQLTQLQEVCNGAGQLPGEEIPDVLGELPVPLPQQPTEDELIEFCNGLFDGDFVNLATVGTLVAACDGDRRTVTIEDVSVLGAPAPDLEGEIAPNTPFLPENPLFNLILNRQSEGPNGAQNVAALVAELGGGEGEVVVSSASCGERIAEPVEEDRDPEPPTAPAPTPVTTSAPVTG
jgi:hypothetical protein